MQVSCFALHYHAIYIHFNVSLDLVLKDIIHLSLVFSGARSLESEV